MKFDNIYDFYKLDDSKAFKITESREILFEGDFKESERLSRYCPARIYFPIKLKAKCFNYGKRYGLIHLNFYKHYNGKYVVITGAKSPDDLDIQVDYLFSAIEDGEKMYKRIFNYLNDLDKKVEYDYKEIINYIYLEFKEFGGDTYGI